jgi:hypothetical protein
MSKRDVPFGRLAASFVRLCLFGFLTQPGSAVRVLFSHGPLVGQISGAVHDDNQGAYYRPVDRHVGEDACCMSSAKVGEIHRLGRHAAAMARVRDLGREGASSESAEAEVRRGCKMQACFGVDRVRGCCSIPMLRILMWLAPASPSPRSTNHTP